MFQIILFLIIGLAAGYAWHVFSVRRTIESKEITLKNVEVHTQKEIEEMKKQVSSHIEEKKENLSKSIEDAKKRSSSIEEMLSKREELILKREEGMKEKIQEMQKFVEIIHNEEKEIHQNDIKVVDLLLDKTKMSFDKAKDTLYKNLQIEMDNEKKSSLDKVQERIKENAEILSENLITGILQRYTIPNATRMKFDYIPLPQKVWEKYKDLLNILVEVSEVELDYNEEKEGLYVGHFNLVRRAIVHNALVNIVKKKLFNEIDIKKELKRASDQIHAHMLKLGEKTFKMLSIPQNMFPEELKKLVGRLYYRTSFGQNILEHSIEVAFFSQMLASEVGLDIEKAKLAGLFHDLGKAIDQDVEGSHDLLTKQILEEHHVDPGVVFAAYNHHDAEPMTMNEGFIVQAADAISATRPGARQESGEQFTEKIRMLEEKAYATKGVKKAYAIQAGRELRALFDPEKVNDTEMGELVKQLAHNIEEEGGYPGTVMVRGVRELKVTETIKK